MLTGYKKNWGETVLLAIALLLAIPAYGLRDIVLWEIMAGVATIAFFRDYIYAGIVHKKITFNIAGVLPRTYTGVWAILYGIGTILFLAVIFLTPFIADW